MTILCLLQKILEALLNPASAGLEVTDLSIGCLYDSEGEYLGQLVRCKKVDEETGAVTYVTEGAMVDNTTISPWVAPVGVEVRNCNDMSALLEEVKGLKECMCGPCPEEEGTNAFDVTDVDRTANSKFNLDDPTFSNAYGDIGLANWTAADLAAALNANAASANGPTVPSNIDYTTTVWASSGELVYVVSGPIPTTLDLVSLSVSLPITATV